MSSESTIKKYEFLLSNGYRLVAETGTVHEEFILLNKVSVYAPNNSHIGSWNTYIVDRLQIIAWSNFLK